MGTVDDKQAGLRPFERAVAEVDADKVQAVIQVVTDSVDSPHSKRAYARAMRDFMRWYRETGQVGLSKGVVARYRAGLAAQGMGASSINQRLSAIRKLAGEAADNGALTIGAAAGIQNVRGIRQTGQRLGFWLCREQAQALLDAPDVETLKGTRDRALLAVLLGCGLRRSEAARLGTEHLVRRDGRWLIGDLLGKRGRIRTVVVPAWAMGAIERWTGAAGITQGPVFRSVTKGGAVGETLSEVGVSWVVKEYGARLGYDRLAAHDLRRTYAKLSRAGGAALEQIQLSLGHASLTTTERYLGTSLDLRNAPGDKLGLGITAS